MSKEVKEVEVEKEVKFTKAQILEEIEDLEDMLDEEIEDMLNAEPLEVAEIEAPETEEVDTDSYFKAGKGVELFRLFKEKDKTTASKIYNKARLNYLKGVTNE